MGGVGRVESGVWSREGWSRGVGVAGVESGGWS